RCSGQIPCAARKLAGRSALDACGQSGTVRDSRTEWVWCRRPGRAKHRDAFHHPSRRIEDDADSRSALGPDVCPQSVDVTVDSDRSGEAFRLVGEAQLLWTSCAAVLREQVSEAVWLSSFAETTALSVDDQRLVLCVPSPWVKERIESRYLEMVRAAQSDVGATCDIES